MSVRSRNYNLIQYTQPQRVQKGCVRGTSVRAWKSIWRSLTRAAGQRQRCAGRRARIDTCWRKCRRFQHWIYELKRVKIKNKERYNSQVKPSNESAFTLCFAVSTASWPAIINTQSLLCSMLFVIRTIPNTVSMMLLEADSRDSNCRRAISNA